MVTVGPLRTNSPVSFGAHSFPEVGSTILASRKKFGVPILPIFLSASLGSYAKTHGPTSVIPNPCLNTIL